MNVSIHQPAYFPYPGFFHKLSLSDVFVIMDDVQYDTRYTNRNKIVDNHEGTWLTVPVKHKHRFLSNIEVEIDASKNWQTKHWKKIYHTYNKSKYFHLYRDFVKNIYQKKWDLLFDLNFEVLKKILEILEMKIEIVKESELNISGTATERLVNVCKAIGADTYISGSGGRNYLDEKLFKKNNLKIVYQKYNPAKYVQHGSEKFIPNLSILDMLANVGKDTFGLITSKK